MPNDKVQVNQRNQIVIPASVRRKLRIKAGDKLIVDVRERSILLIPEPESYTDLLGEVARELWRDVDGVEWSNTERDSWKK